MSSSRAGGRIRLARAEAAPKVPVPSRPGPRPGSAGVFTLNRFCQRRPGRPSFLQKTDMAHSLSAKKRIRQNVKRNALNRWRKDRVKDAVRAFDAAIESGKLEEAQKLLNAAASTIDKVASTPAMHKNTAARRRSRLARRLNAAKAARPANA